MRYIVLILVLGFALKGVGQESKKDSCDMYIPNSLIIDSTQQGRWAITCPCLVSNFDVKIYNTFQDYPPSVLMDSTSVFASPLGIDFSRTVVVDGEEQNKYKHGDCVVWDIVFTVMTANGLERREDRGSLTIVRSN